MEQSPTRRRINGAFPIGGACLVALLIGSQLHSYRVPLGLITPCMLSVLSSALWLLIRAEEAWSSTRHRCSAQGCTFEVRVQNPAPRTTATGRKSPRPTPLTTPSEQRIPIQAQDPNASL
ncbi:hypothetical protein [Streptomyces sp. 1222.5]|uniref:hypothetical protein n=1 Tax=Streptomyces sp. 1222.5 TaxID=1881026 RepID=UPI003D765E8A